MNKLAELRQLMTACAERMNVILSAADNEHRNLSADEEAEYDRLDKGIDDCKVEIDKIEKDEARRSKLNNVNTFLNQPQRSFPIPGIIVKPSDDDKEFKSLGEFLYLMRFDADNRKLAEYREQTMSVGEEGGLMVPSQFRPEIFKIDPDTALVRPRATVIPAGSPPDAEITFPVLNQSTNMYGGITMYKVAEGVSTTESDAKLKDVSMKPNGVGGHVEITNKLLRNWQAAGSFITTQMQGARTYYEDMQFMSGNGVGGPTGFLGHKSNIKVNRGTANQISYTDTVNMLARILMRGGNYVWITSQTTIPQLATLADAGNNNIWHASAAAGMPTTLHGIPVLFHERVPALGTMGDLMLVNLSYYLIKDGSGPYVRVSDQVRFLQDKTIFQVIWNIDGKPWLDAPIKLEGGAAANTVSPFVILN